MLYNKLVKRKNIHTNSLKNTEKKILMKMLIINTILS